METKLLFQDASAFETPMLAVFAVDLSAGKSDTAQPRLLSASPALVTAAQHLLGPRDQEGRFVGRGEAVEQLRDRVHRHALERW